MEKDLQFSKIHGKGRDTTIQLRNCEMILIIKLLNNKNITKLIESLNIPIRNLYKKSYLKLIHFALMYGLNYLDKTYE